MQYELWLLCMYWLKYIKRITTRFSVFLNFQFFFNLASWKNYYFEYTKTIFMVKIAIMRNSRSHSFEQNISYKEKRLNSSVSRASSRPACCLHMLLHVFYTLYTRSFYCHKILYAPIEKHRAIKRPCIQRVEAYEENTRGPSKIDFTRVNSTPLPHHIVRS